MILQSITLSGWRCFLEEVMVGPFSDRLNVICGPNGIGKSTLFEALRRALMDSHSVTGQDISAIRPWGRSLSPKVIVAFTHGSAQYRVTKQFLDGGFALLERKENAAFRPLAEGRQADEQARELLSKNPPGKGLSQSRHWGLAQVLWAPQGELKLLDLSGDLVSDIRNLLGAQVTDKSSGPIEQKLFEIYERYYTSQGRIRSGRAAPPIVHLNEAIEKAEEQRGEALKMLQRCEEASRRVEELGARHKQMVLDAEELVIQLRNNRARADQYRILRTDLKNRKGELERIEAQYRQTQQHLDLIRSTEKELGEKRTDLDRFEKDLPLKRREVEDREKDSIKAKKLLDAARKGEDVVAKAETHAEAARQYVDYTHQRKELSQGVQHIEAAQQTLSERKKIRAELVGPDRQTLKAVRKAVQARDEAKLLMDAAMISLEIVPESDGFLDVIIGEDLGELPLSAGKVAVVKGSPEIVAELKGVARLRASGPGEDIESHRQTVRTKEKEISELTRPFGTSDLARLEEQWETAESLDRQVGEALKALETLLGDETLDGLKKELARLDALLEGIEKEHTGWNDLMPDTEGLKRVAADLKREQVQKISNAETAWEKAQSALSSAKEQEQILSDRLEEVRKAERKLKAQHSDLTRDGKSLQEQEAGLNRVLLDWDAGKAALKDVEDKLTQFEDDPEAVLEKLEKNLAATQDSVQRTRDEERKAMGTLETLAAQGSYSILAQADEEIARLEAEIDREALQMDAVKLLYETVHECRTEAVASVAKPVEETATRLLHRIAGRRIGQIQMGEDFGPSGMRPELANSPVDLINLSGGEQEQLYLATRLALAEALAKAERQMVVLDDVLTATDTGRLARVMSILEEATEHLQILILTCHPERYRALTEAQFFDLESLIES
ncbi:MAG: AAA family ATPase [Pseudomonadota bacterium]